MSQTYGVKVSSLEVGLDALGGELDHLLSLVESPDPEYKVQDAVLYCEAIATFSEMIEFLVGALSLNEISPDGVHIKMSSEEIVVMGHLSDTTEEIRGDLLKQCGISLAKN